MLSTCLLVGVAQVHDCVKYTGTYGYKGYFFKFIHTLN